MQLLCYVATTFGEKSTALVEEEIMAYQNVRTRRLSAFVGLQCLYPKSSCRRGMRSTSFA